MKILNSREKREIEKMLKESYGCEDLLGDYVVLKTEDGEIWLTNQELFGVDLSKLRVRNIGLYFGRIEHGRIQLSIEGCQIVGKRAKRNIVQIKKEWDFIRGFDVKADESIDCKEGSYVLVKFNEDFLGTGKLNDGLVKNAVPRNRKIISLTREKDL